MNRSELINIIKQKKSFLCVGLDTDLKKIPAHILKEKDPVFAFNKAIIDATHDLAVAYKPNLAFYECLGPAGWESLMRTIEYMPKDVFTIADAKRGDIGNTSNYYAKTFFEWMNFDSITVAPYMGRDSVGPFLEFKNKWVILLALTSNEGALDFQFTESAGTTLFEKVILKSSEWGSPENLMYVIGATRGEMLKKVREVAPEHFFLIPGVGAQGGSLQDVVNYAMNDDIGVLVNSSRGIIYADNSTEFAVHARSEASKIQKEMEAALLSKGLL